MQAMREGDEAVDEGMRLAREASTSLKKMLDSSKKSSEMSASIERTTAEQARTARYVSEAIERVRHMVDEIARATSEQSRGANLIIQASEKMRDASHQADKATGQQEEVSRQIADSVENISSRTHQISRAIQEQKMGARQIWTSVEKIKDLPEKTRNLAFSINKAVRELSKNAELITIEMDRFRLSESRAEDTVVFGVVPFDLPANLFRKFNPLMEYLSRETGKQFELRVTSNFKSATDEIKEGALQLCFMNSLTYIRANETGSARPLAVMLREGKPLHRSVIVAREDSRIKEIKDLNNRSFAFVDRFSVSGHYMPVSLMMDEGVSVDNLSYFNFLGSHEEVLRAVMKGDFDAGGIMESVYEELGTNVRVIARSPEMPEFVICAGTALGSNLADALNKALLKLRHGSPDSMTLLGVIDRKYTGCAEAFDNDFDSVRELVKKVGNPDA